MSILTPISSLEKEVEELCYNSKRPVRLMASIKFTKYREFRLTFKRLAETYDLISLINQSALQF